jgi:hypothetical protein
VTDYELGTDVLPMLAHLAIDATIGVKLIVAGLTLRNEPGSGLGAAGETVGLPKPLLTSLIEREPDYRPGRPA